MSEPRTITLLALESKNLDTVCYRGSAPIAELTRMSGADVFDQDLNPEGLQRDLSQKHAAEAYDYVARDADPKFPRAWPEVMLNVRDKKVLKVEPVTLDVITDGKPASEPAAAALAGVQLVGITVDLDAIDNAKTTKISRVDGNHRLFFGAGDGKKATRGPLDAVVPFQLHIGLTRDQEAAVFGTTNSEQKGLNTSHLHVIDMRITPEERELERHPERVFARDLSTDVASPWHNLVHMGGSKAKKDVKGRPIDRIYRPVNFVALEQGLRRTLRTSQYLKERGTDVQYGLLRNYWQAMKEVYPEAFADPREYLILKNLGVATFSQLAGMVIDRCLVEGAVECEDMVKFIEATKGTVDWHRESADVAGMSGNRAVLLLAGRMSAKLPTPVSV
jgi:DGQHR domain-containing protein